MTMNNVLSFENNFYPLSNYSAEHNLIPKAYHGDLQVHKCNKQIISKENLKKKAWINIFEITMKVCQNV